MLAQNSLPQSLWVEAVNIGCHTQNRSIIHRRFNKTRYQIINNRIPTVKYFKVFGRCFVLNEKDDRGKFRAKADEIIFIGYSSTSKAFKVYNRSTHEVMESIHVSFDEKGEMVFESSKSEPILTSVRVFDKLHSNTVQSAHESDSFNSNTDLYILFEIFYVE